MVDIILADDHKVVRKGLKALLSTESDFNVVGEAENGLEAMEMVESLSPDILVLDLMMPVLGGLEVTRLLSQKPGRTHVVILSMHSNEAYIVEALRLGAQAYILKESPPEELIKGIHEVFAGNRFLSAPLSLETIDDLLLAGKSSFDWPQSLTRREEEILRLAAGGLSNQSIAQKLKISARTVETHRNNLMHKLNLHSQVQMTNLAVQRGLISVTDITEKTRED